MLYSAVAGDSYERELKCITYAVAVRESQVTQMTRDELPSCKHFCRTSDFGHGKRLQRCGKKTVGMAKRSSIAASKQSLLFFSWQISKTSFRRTMGGIFWGQAVRQKLISIFFPTIN